MTPQHFQQQALWEHACNERVAHIASVEPWGVYRVSFDADALKAGRLRLEHLQIRLQDGTWIDSGSMDRLPAPRHLDDIPAGKDAVVVSVCLAMFDLQGGNFIDEGAKPGRPRRFIREFADVVDLHGEGKDEIGVERHALALQFDFETSADFISCPVGRLVRDAQGAFALDTTYVPPCLAVSASDPLIERTKRLMETLLARSSSLAARRKERAGQIADYGVTDVPLLWLLNTVNMAWPELARLSEAPDQHPERLYSVLARLAAMLLTFSTTETLKSIPSYKHADPGPAFASLDELICKLLDSVIPSSVVAIDLERVRPTLWSGQIKDQRLVEHAEYYLAVRTALPAHELLEQLPRLCKIGAPDEVQEIVNSALPGIPLHAMSRLPAAIPVRVDNHYFVLDGRHPAFKRMVDAHACQIYVPASIPDASVELYAVIPT